MQTFLPYPNFAESARVLDYRRLEKQRVEAKQIYLALTQPNYGWKNHPAVRMWKGHERNLIEYGFVICDEWQRRGYQDTLKQFFMDHSLDYRTPPIYPLWLGNSDFHLSHQSNLLRKDPKFYGPKFPGVPNNLPYIWPEP